MRKAKYTAKDAKNNSILPRLLANQVLSLNMNGSLKGLPFDKFWRDFERRIKVLRGIAVLVVSTCVRLMASCAHTFANDFRGYQHRTQESQEKKAPNCGVDRVRKFVDDRGLYHV